MDNIIPVDKSNILDEDRNKLLQFIKQITESIQQPSFNYSGHNLAVSIETRNSSTATEIKSFDIQHKMEIEFSDADNVTRNKTEHVTDDLVSSIYIPEATYTDTQTEVKIISTANRKDTFFITTTPNQTYAIGSYIMSASIKSQKIENLTVPIKLRFEVNESVYNASAGQCVFWETGKEFIMFCIILNFS